MIHYLHSKIKLNEEKMENIEIKEILKEINDANKKNLDEMGEKKKQTLIKKIEKYFKHIKVKEFKNNSINSNTAAQILKGLIKLYTSETCFKGINSKILENKISEIRWYLIAIY